MFVECSCWMSRCCFSLRVQLLQECGLECLLVPVWEGQLKVSSSRQLLDMQLLETAHRMQLLGSRQLNVEKSVAAGFAEFYRSSSTAATWALAGASSRATDGSALLVSTTRAWSAAAGSASDG
ncbi:unnamed protein product [Polarella glacialis]|uniref:Uncharacterized protein n=1 Tax=Polarella glacialis TaxID=89957 RepID=A0A813F411_POLGL|nr:unnamed protein product [Polarella glacialis]CAE8626059.1 unnamed protein product [Polarella glacialis]